MIRFLLAILISLTAQVTFSQGSGNTLLLNGSTQFFGLGNTVANNCRTIEFWFNSTVNVSPTLANPIALMVRDFNNGNAASTNEFGICFYPSTWSNSGGKIGFYRNIGSTKYEIFSDDNSWDANRWYHVAAVIDPVTGMKLYINGNLQQSTEPSIAPIQTQTGSINDRVAMGRWGNFNGRYFQGQFDEVKFWESARTETEIKNKMCSKLTGNEPNLRAYYEFDSSVGTTLIDGSPNNNNGTTYFLPSNSWVTSSAPVGDVSNHSYPTNGINGQTHLFSTGAGDVFELLNISSNAKGVHLYKVNSAPNTLVGANSPFTGNYYGVFFTNTGSFFDLNYDFSGYGCNSCLDISSRNDNASPNWTNLTGTNANCVYNLTNQSSIGNSYRGEYIVHNAFIDSINLGNDTVLCTGENLILDATLQNATYLWHDGSTAPIFTVTQTGTYHINRSLGGCSSKDTIQVNFLPQPSISIGNDTSLCQGNQLLLNAGNGTAPGVTFLWNNHTTTPSLSVTTGGTYSVTITDNNGCTASDTILVNLIPLPSLSLGPDIDLCDGDSLIADASAPNSTYLWNDGSTQPQLTITQTGLYHVARSALGCTLFDSIQIQFTPYPTFSLGRDTLLCENENLVLDATVTNATYNWQDNTTQSTFDATTAGWYWVDVDLNNCIVRDSIRVNFTPLPYVNLGPDTTLCNGDTIRMSVLSQNATIQWSTGTAVAKEIVTQAGTYSVTVTENNCSTTDARTFTSIKNVNIEIGNDTLLCNGQSLLISIAENYLSHTWNETIQGAEYEISAPGLYRVETENLCSVTRDSIEVFYEQCNCLLYLPNAFTPNGDGRNDSFGPDGICNPLRYSFFVFDRWGNTLFESSIPYEKWDGKLNNEIGKDGIYAWMLEYNNPYTLKREKKLGKVLLIK